MSDPSLDLQKAVGALLAADPGVTALVPPAAIFDRSLRPEVFPCVILGEGQEVNESVTLRRDLVKVYMDLHVWTADESVAPAKAIAGAVGDALRRGPIVLAGLVDAFVSHVRHMRDPAGVRAHSVLTLETLMRLDPL